MPVPFININDLEHQVQFQVMGKPKPQLRHRHGRGRTWDPCKKDKQDFAAIAFYEIKDYKGKEFISQCLSHPGYIALEIDFVMPIPKSTSKKDKERMTNGIVPHVKKPDIDNMCKFVMDSLNGILWQDDSMISELETTKFYGPVAKTVITVTYLDIGLQNV